MSSAFAQVTFAAGCERRTELSVLPPAVTTRSFELVSGAQRGVSAATLRCELLAPSHETYPVNLGFVELAGKVKFREKCQVQLC